MTPTTDGVRVPDSTSNEDLFRALAHAHDPVSRDDLRSEIFARNQGLAMSIAHRYMRRSFELDDVTQVACLGLVKAINGYEVGRGIPFHSYAMPTIAGEVKRYFRDRVWVIRPPRQLQELHRVVDRVHHQLAQEKRGEPARKEIAETLGLTTRALDRAEQAAGYYSALSLDAPCRGDDESTLGEQLADPADEFERVDLLESVRTAIEGFGERDKRIIALRFVDGHSQAEIGRKLGVSQMQVSRLLGRIIRRLREALELSEAAA